MNTISDFKLQVIEKVSGVNVTTSHTLETILVMQCFRVVYRKISHERLDFS